MVAGMKPMTDCALQACAVAYRHRSGRLEFCLITTSQGRWNWPKGIVDPGETREQAALREAYEEAGLHGRLVGPSLSTYPLNKFGRQFEVTSWLMEVQDCEEQWEEQTTRQRRWVTPTVARRLLSQPHLRDLLDRALQRLEP